jgi:hypothetical protein
MKPSVEKVRCISSNMRMVVFLADRTQHSFLEKGRLRVAMLGGGSVRDEARGSLIEQSKQQAVAGNHSLASIYTDLDECEAQ